LNVSKTGKSICILLCAIFILSFFSGCSISDIFYPDDESESSSSDAAASSSNNVDDNDDDNTAVNYDSDFTLNCSGSGNYNPFDYSNSADKDVSTLIYDNLFVLDSAFDASSTLLEKYTTKNGIKYDFTLISGITMHDGSELDSADVVYSINLATVSSNYSSRLSCIKRCESTGDYTFTITLNSANYRFVSLLDVPIVSYGTGEDSNPVGTGPYVLSESGDRLIPFDNYRNSEYEHMDRIELEAFSYDITAASFLSHDIDLVHMDSVDIDDLNIRVDCERSYINTSTLQYIGFNTKNEFLSSQRVRRAIGSAVDRNYIAGTIMSSGALPAPLILSPALSCYDVKWENNKLYSPSTTEKVFKDMNMKDENKDGFLEYEKDGEYIELSLKFIVNEESQYKVLAAQHVTESLNSLGLNVELEQLPWDEYLYALATGDFDMYYAEARVPADFDVSAFFTEEGSLNYGGMTDENLVSLISDFLAASTEEEISETALTLCNSVYSSSYLIPVVYTKESVISHWGTLENMTYSQSGVFCNIGVSSSED
jgi:peptide/nickel transport system substrate-binding protein